MIRQAVFLVGGLGTRLKERTKLTPKPLLEIGGRPFIEYLLDEAARHRFSNILLIAGHMGEQVRKLYDGREWRGSRIRVVVEPEPLGTGGALRFARPQLEPQFLLSNGDSFFDVNLRALVAPGLIVPGGISMALRASAPDSRYGRVRFEDGLVKSFHAPEEGFDGPINGGIYGIDRTVIDTLPDGKVSLEQVIFPQVAAAGKMRGLLSDGYFIDIGVPLDFERADIEVPARFVRPAVFFDRDGVLNHDAGYTHRKEDFRWIDGAKAAVRRCNDAGLLAFVVTNQAGVARGLYDEDAVRALHRWVDGELAQAGAHIDAYEFCPHHVEGVVAGYNHACRRRKPEPGMIQDLLQAWPVEKARSLLVGDKQSDLDAAKTAGIAAHYFAGGDLDAFLAPLLPQR